MNNSLKDNILIRKATPADAPAVYAVYERVLDKEAASPRRTHHWQKGLYPTEKTVAEALQCGDLYVLELSGKIAAAARLNQQQMSIYAECPWQYPADPAKVLVIHTLAVDPAASGRGLAKRFIAFYEQQARELGCTVLRLDTHKLNSPARGLYTSLGFREAAILTGDFNGMCDVELVCLEKKIQ